MTDFIISEEQLDAFEHLMGFKSEMRSRPLSDELEKAYRHGFNDGQAEGLPEALKVEREGIITKLETRKENYKKYVVGVEMKELARIRIEEIEGIIESLRSEQP